MKKVTMHNPLIENINEIFDSIELFRQLTDDQCINNAIRYNSEGRIFGCYSGIELYETWIKMITENLESIRTNDRLRRDIESEFLVGRKKSPYHRVLAEIDKIQRGAEQLAAMVTSNPALLNLIKSEIDSRAAESARDVRINR